MFKVEFEGTGLLKYYFIVALPTSLVMTSTFDLGGGGHLGGEGAGHGSLCSCWYWCTLLCNEVLIKTKDDAEDVVLNKFVRIA